MSEKEIQGFQHRRLQDIIEFSYQYFPTYRGLWEEEGFEPGSFENLKDIENAPITDRETAAKIETEGVPIQVSRKYYSTGTTGGDVMEVPFEDQAADWTESITLRTELRAGYRPFNTIAEYWGLPQTRIGNILRPKTRVPKEATIEEQAELIREKNPDYLIYGAHMLFRIAKLIDRQADFEGKINKVFNNGELLTPNMRQKIEDVLDTEVFNVYETAEFGQIGWECPEGGYHVNQDLVYHEILDEEGEEVDEGEIGEMVVTTLVNRAKPLVRYRTGDMVVKGENSCNCKTNFEKIGEIQGRKNNLVENDSGETVYPREIIDRLAEFDRLEKFVFERENGENGVLYESSSKNWDSTVRDIKDSFSEIGLEEVSIEEKEAINRINWKAAPVRNPGP